MSSRIERAREAGLGGDLGRFGESTPEGGVTLLLQTFAATAYPTVPQAFYACRPVGVDGTEVEGSDASFTVDGARVIHAYNLGSTIPPSGSRFLGHLASGCWFFSWNA